MPPRNGSWSGGKRVKVQSTQDAQLEAKRTALRAGQPQGKILSDQEREIFLTGRPDLPARRE
jgi:hypothetical protein